ncbi:YicC family protein [Candidatus Aerophobetes bacterium]|nr:YicC family protein [Candidatus Aerophobetes bacterium]
MRSMTGYGEGEERIGEEGVYVEIKTINDRFLKIDINSSTPLPFNFERLIKKYIEKEIKRGRVIVRIKVKEKPSYKLKINKDLLCQYYKTFLELAQKLEVKEKPSLANFLNLPEITWVEKKEGKLREKIMEKALKKALKEVVLTREKEGGTHLKNIQKSIEKVKKEILEIEKKIPFCEEVYRERMRKELKRLLPEEKEKIAKEILFFANRNNINEEKVRIRSHIEQLKQTLRRKKCVGRRIEFILQELHREVNTMGAKAISFPLSSHIIRIKEEIEKIRELTQNIE